MPDGKFSTKEAESLFALREGPQRRGVMIGDVEDDDREAQPPKSAALRREECQTIMHGANAGKIWFER